MNNLHRELAPISDAAWSQIDDEATRTLKRHMAARRVVDVHGPAGFDFSAVGTGHVALLEAALDSVSARLRDVRPPVELLAPFELDRQAIDDGEPGYRVGGHIRRLGSDGIVGAPAISGAFVLSTRGGDFALHMGQDVSIGSSSHTDPAVRLYLQETFTFLLLTTEAAVAFRASAT